MTLDEILKKHEPKIKTLERVRRLAIIDGDDYLVQALSNLLMIELCKEIDEMLKLLCGN